MKSGDLIFDVKKWNTNIGLILNLLIDEKNGYEYYNILWSDSSVTTNEKEFIDDQYRII